jgi:hypothetical protein
MVSYRNGEVEACGVDALQDFEEHQENVAYWFKVILYFTIPGCFIVRNLTCE